MTEDIDINHAYEETARFFSRYSDQTDSGYQLKITHTYHVAANAKKLAGMLGMSEEDRKLAELIGLLHDVGRFEELHVSKKFDSARFDHASCGVKMLFEEGMIRDFIGTDAYDEIIRAAIQYHSGLSLPEIEDERTLLHAKLIRDADKLDNFRVKIEEPAENIFPGHGITKQNVEESCISPAVYETLMQRQCVRLADRVTPLDYFVTIIGFYFDLNFAETKQIVHEERLIERMVSRFDYKDETAAVQIHEIVKLTEE